MEVSYFFFLGGGVFQALPQKSKKMIIAYTHLSVVLVGQGREGDG